MPGPNQLPLFETTHLSMVEATPAAAWELDATKRALDELFRLTFRYRTSADAVPLLSPPYESHKEAKENKRGRRPTINP